MLRILLLACMALPAAAQIDTTTATNRKAPSGDRLLVCNKSEHTISIFSPRLCEEIAVLPTGKGPHEVAVSPDGRTAVVTDYGEQKPGHTLTVIDIAAAKIIGKIDLPQTQTPSTNGDESGKEPVKKFPRPHGIQFVSQDQVIVTSEATRRLLRVNIKTGKVEHSWPTAQPTMHMVSVTSNGRFAATSSIVGGTVAFFDLQHTDSPAPILIATGNGAEGIAVHPLSGDAWIGNRAANTLSVVRRGSGKIAKTLKTGDFPFRVAFTADQRHVLVTCAEGGELQIYDAAKLELAREVSIHGDRSEQSSLPLGVTSDPDSRLAYVTCARGEFVAVVDLEKAEVIDRIDTRKGPDGIAYARSQPQAVKRERD